MKQKLSLLFLIFCTALNMNAQKFRPGIYKESSYGKGSQFIPSKIEFNRNGTFSSDLLSDFPICIDNNMSLSSVAWWTGHNGNYTASGTYRASNGLITLTLNYVSGTKPGAINSLYRTYTFKYDDNSILIGDERYYIDEYFESAAEKAAREAAERREEAARVAEEAKLKAVKEVRHKKRAIREAEFIAELDKNTQTDNKKVITFWIDSQCYLFDDDKVKDLALHSFDAVKSLSDIEVHCAQGHNFTINGDNNYSVTWCDAEKDEDISDENIREKIIAEKIADEVIYIKLKGCNLNKNPLYENASNAYSLSYGIKYYHPKTGQVENEEKGIVKGTLEDIISKSDILTPILARHSVQAKEKHQEQVQQLTDRVSAIEKELQQEFSAKQAVALQVNTANNYNGLSSDKENIYKCIADKLKSTYGLYAYTAYDMDQTLSVSMTDEQIKPIVMRYKFTTAYANVRLNERKTDVEKELKWRISPTTFQKEYYDVYNYSVEYNYDISIIPSKIGMEAYNNKKIKCKGKSDKDTKTAEKIALDKFKDIATKINHGLEEGFSRTDDEMIETNYEAALATSLSIFNPNNDIMLIVDAPESRKFWNVTSYAKNLDVRVGFIDGHKMESLSRINVQAGRHVIILRMCGSGTDLPDDYLRGGGRDLIIKGLHVPTFITKLSKKWSIALPKLEEIYFYSLQAPKATKYIGNSLGDRKIFYPKEASGYDDPKWQKNFPDWSFNQK